MFIHFTNAASRVRNPGRSHGISSARRTPSVSSVLFDISCSCEINANWDSFKCRLHLRAYKDFCNSILFWTVKFQRFPGGRLFWRKFSDLYRINWHLNGLINLPRERLGFRIKMDEKIIFFFRKKLSITILFEHTFLLTIG